MKRKPQDVVVKNKKPASSKSKLSGATLERRISKRGGSGGGG